MVTIEKEGKTVEEAIASGLLQLGMTRDEVDIEVLREGGLFRKALVKITTHETKAEKVALFVEGLLEKMGMDCQVDVNEVNYNVTLSGKDSAGVIGYRGEVLEALQYLTHIAVNKDDEDYVKITMDVEGYRAKRAKTLADLAKRLADKAVRTNQAVELEPMSSADRKCIHEALVNNSSVTTESVGNDPNRHVVIKPKEREITYGTGSDFRRNGFKNVRSFGNKRRRF